MIQDKLITHNNSISFELQTYINNLKNNLQKSEKLSFEIPKMLELLKQLSEFELGRFLLINKGLNGFWISSIINNKAPAESLHPLENWVLNKSPAMISTRERFHIFRRETQKLLFDNMSLASIPCGLMDDLLSLDYSVVKNISLYGIDLDSESLSLAERNIANYNVNKQVKIKFLLKNAWNLELFDKFDVITSNGLNVYEHDDNKTTELYNQFYLALKPGGSLITSFLVPPQGYTSKIDLADLKLQRAIFGEIIKVNWQAFRSQELTQNQLEKVGFKDIQY
nr:class I SAM-dependent methyltransferase [Gammaproteobacteria bacterium]